MSVMNHLRAQREAAGGGRLISGGRRRGGQAAADVCGNEDAPEAGGRAGAAGAARVRGRGGGYMSMMKFSQNHHWKDGQSARSSFCSPVPHIDSTMSVSKAISSGTAMPQ